VRAPVKSHAVGTRVRPSLTSSVELEIRSSLGTSDPEVKKSREFRRASIPGHLPGLYVLILFIFIIFRVVVVLVEVVFVFVGIVVIKNVIDTVNVDGCHDAGSVAGFGLSRFGGGYVVQK